MQTASTLPQLKLKLAKDGDSSVQGCWAQDIGTESLFASGASALREGDRVHLEINPGDRNGLHLNAQVVNVTNRGATCRFKENSAASLEVLGALLTPTWDGENLLDGVLKLAAWEPGQDLASWMRLTSLVSDWQRMSHKPMRLYQ